MNIIKNFIKITMFLVFLPVIIPAVLILGMMCAGFQQVIDKIKK